MDFLKLAGNLELGDDGIWYCTNPSQVSYPECGNEWCFQIESESYWFQHRNRCITALIRNFPPPGTLYDVGGGNGFVAHAIQELGYDVVVVEPGKTGVYNASARGVQNVVCSTLEDAGFPDNTLPAISLFDVIEHIDHDVAFLIKVKELLARHGRLYLSTPAYPLLHSAEDEFAGHYRRYTISDLKKRLELAGFSVEFMSYMFSFLPIPIFLLRTLPSKLGLKRDYHLEQDTRKHTLPAGVTGRMLERIMGFEVSRLQRRKRVPFGGSCLVVARRS